MMTNHDESVEINHQLTSYFQSFLHVLTIGGSGSDKTTVLLNLRAIATFSIVKVGCIFS